MNWDIQPFDVLPSTQSELKAKASTAPEGTVVWARQQTQGYGRKKDPWQSSRGGLYISLLLKPTQLMPHLPQVILLSVADTIQSLSDISFDIKWPNDIWTQAGKISGFLIDSQVLGAYPRYYVCGLGFNLNQTDLMPPAVSLKTLTGRDYDIHGCLMLFLDKLSTHYKLAVEGPKGFEAYFKHQLKAFQLILPCQKESEKENIYV